MPRLQEKYIRSLVRTTLQNLLEDKPGGGLTDFGAKYRIEKNAAIAAARQALVSAEGDVDGAAQTLGISPSALRYYLDLEPSLEKTKEKESGETSSKNESFKAYYDMLLEQEATGDAPKPKKPVLSAEEYAQKVTEKLKSSGEGGVGMLTKKAGTAGVSVVLYKTNVFVGNLLFGLDTESGSGADKELIASATEKSIVGMITLDVAEDPCNDAMVVKYVFSAEGYGPLLYTIGMQLSPSGKIISDRTAVSDPAFGLWQVFNSRGDIKKEPLDDKEDPKTPQKSDDCETWAYDHPEKEILDYSYKGGSDIDLNTLRINNKDAMAIVNRYTQQYLGWSPEVAGDYISSVADYMFMSVYHAMPMASRGLKVRKPRVKK